MLRDLALDRLGRCAEPGRAGIRHGAFYSLLTIHYSP
jgi:hypothetical protein